MDGREGGFIVLHRRIQSSALWLSMRGDQRGVFLTILLLANWKPARARWRDQWYEVRRGELSHTLATIAKEANASVKVVRSTLAILMSDDKEVGGNGAAVTERYPISGTGPGTGPRVLTVVNYSKYQDVHDGAGTGSGTDRARVGHGSGTGRAQIEQGEPVEPVEQQQADEPTSSIRPRSIHLQGQCPKLYDLLARAAASGVGVNEGRFAAPWGEAEALIGQIGPEAALAAWTSAAARRSGGQDSIPLNYLLGPLRDAAKRGGVKGGRGPVAVPSDWSKGLEDIA